MDTSATPAIEDVRGLIDEWMGGTPLAVRSTRESPLGGLPIFGFDTVSSLLMTCALEAPGRRLTLAFAGACVLGSICSFLQGTWPIGSIEGAGALVALGSLRRQS